MYGRWQRALSSHLITGCAFLITALVSLEAGSVVHARPTLHVLPDRAVCRDADLPARSPGTSRADTLQFGYVDAGGYAVLGETWSFDHGGGDLLEGWSAFPLAEEQLPFRHMTAADWNGHGNPSPAPILVGQGSAWLGAFESEGNQFCWAGGLGYGNNWCQVLESPGYIYAGSGDVTLSFRYFNDTEPDFDRTRITIEFGDGNELLLNGPVGWDGEIGHPAVGSYPTYSRTIAAAEFGGFTDFHVRIEFRSDGAFSDQDGEFDTDYGPFGVDEVTLTGAISDGPVTYGFESDLEGWTTATCGLAVAEARLGVAPVSNYAILDPCACGLAGKVLEFHDENGEHPTGQHEFGISPIVDRGALGSQYNTLLGTFDIYAEMPLANGVFYRPGWIYFPYVCPESGQSIWSDRVGEEDTYRFVGTDPTCATARDVGTLGTLPGDAHLYRFGFEIFSSCDVFGIPPTQCSGVTNPTPLFDNIRVQVTSVADAPEVRFDVGARFIDGWGQGLLNSTTSPGNADVAYDLSRHNPVPDHLGDSLVVVGPIPTSATRWEARMWWRIAREGPGAASIPGYAAWKAAVADGLGIVGLDSDFTSGRMDSMQSGTAVAKNRFISEFREDDDDFEGENQDGNEMIRDAILAPGTAVQYFITANFTCTPSILGLYPDTSGGNFWEFEILPSYRLESGVVKSPCVLHVNAARDDTRHFYQHGLNVALNGAGPLDPVPGLTSWDTYDYDAACSCFNAPFYRSVGGNNGATLLQLLEYRLILFSAGVTQAGQARDFEALSDWLSYGQCNASENRQGLIVTGDDVASWIAAVYPSLLNNALGARPVCDDYGGPVCGVGSEDESRCVRIEDAVGGAYGTTLVPQGGGDYALSAWGSGCPEVFTFDVLQPTTGGTGNRRYLDHDGGGAYTEYSQVVKSVTSLGSDNYRSVLDGVSWDHLTEREDGNECLSDEAHIVNAIAHELDAALFWIFGTTTVPCAPRCGQFVTDVTPLPSAARDRLEILSISPNPMQGVAAIRFALPGEGDIDLAIFDAGGRRVATVASGMRTAGEHLAAWSGDDSSRRRLSQGVYWAELRSGGARATRKLIRMR